MYTYDFQNLGQSEYEIQTSYVLDIFRAGGEWDWPNNTVKLFPFTHKLFQVANLTEIIICYYDQYNEYG